MTVHTTYAILFVVGINHPEDDSKLIEGCINRDLAAWSIFLNRYSDLISIAIKNRLKKYGFDLPCEEMEDIRQDILISLWNDRKLESVKNPKALAYWLAIVSGNAAIKHVRDKHISEPVKPVSIFDKIGEKEILELLPSPGLDPSDALRKHEVLKRINDAVEELPYKEKLIVKLSLFYDKKHHEIAKILNLPDGTISSYMMRAKERLRKLLKDL